MLHQITEDRSCTNKYQHHTLSSALKAISEMKSIGLKPYKCKYCNYFHVGHPMKFISQDTKDRWEQIKQEARAKGVIP